MGKRVEHICEGCNTPRMIEKKRLKTAKYCATCSNVYKWKDKSYPEGVQSKMYRPYVVAARYKEHCKAGYRLLVCPVCSSAHNQRGKCCSLECRQKYIDSYSWQRNIKGKVIECRVCAIRFSPLYKNNGRLTCSDECAKELLREFERNHRRKRGSDSHRSRARRYGAYYEPFNKLTVFERDEWTCQACGTSTPKELMGTIDGNAPELDHIEPLSKGAPHTMNNTQCLCRDCNALKSDMSMREFEKLYINQ